MSIWALIPAKDPALAKSRLAPRVPATARHDFSIYALQRVLRALASTPKIAGRLVISNGEQPLAVARQYGAVPILESQSPDNYPRQAGPPEGAESSLDGLNAAVQRGAMEAIQRGATAVLVIAGDLPLADAASLTTLVTALPDGPGLVIVPDRHGGGTNALLVQPPDLIPFAFGEGSFQRHLRLANEHQVPAVVLNLPNLAHDVDTPEDLEALEALLARQRRHVDMDRAEDRAPANAHAEEVELRWLFNSLVGHDTHYEATCQCR
jgi:2-phospho-L-lactate guanylyltransferase